MPTEKRALVEAMSIVCRALFVTPNNLISTDFSDIQVYDGRQGTHFSFSILDNALGKVLDEEVSAAVELLLSEAEPPRIKPDVM